MKFKAQSGNLLDIKTDLYVVANYEGHFNPKDYSGKINQTFGKAFEKLCQQQDYKGAVAEAKLFQTHNQLKAPYVLYLGLGAAKNLNLDDVRKWGAAIQGVAAQLKCTSIAVEVPGQGAKNVGFADAVQAVVEGYLLSNYQFTAYLENKPSSVKEIILVAPSSHIRKAEPAITLGELVSRGTCLARDLVNTPAADMTPSDLAHKAKTLKGVSTKIHDLAAVKKMKMGAFLSVGLGSTQNPPCFIEMHYKPKGKAKKKIAIVGKGVTFDSGGYSIKPAKAMETMKCDMSGAAAVIGLMSIVAELKPDVEVSGYIAATENMVDGFAQRPGDICTAMNGKTIEVLNTDAEGRLTLADALHYATLKKPDYIIDMATLTGACLVALGLQYTGGMTNDAELLSKLRESGLHCGEKIWELPLADEYKDELKSPIADLKNIGNGYAGTILGGLFLEVFVNNHKWVHLDIAGTAWTDKPYSYIPRGGTGVMVRTLAHFIAQF